MCSPPLRMDDTSADTEGSGYQQNNISVLTQWFFWVVQSEARQRAERQTRVRILVQESIFLLKCISHDLPDGYYENQFFFKFLPLPNLCFLAHVAEG